MHDSAIPAPAQGLWTASRPAPSAPHHPAADSSLTFSSQLEYLLLREAFPAASPSPKPSTSHSPVYFGSPSYPHLKLSCSLMTFSLLTPHCLEPCLAPSWCAVIVKSGWKKVSQATKKPKGRGALSALPSSLTHPSPPQSFSSSAQ